MTNSNWTDIMVDLETTGTDSRYAAIIQLSAVMFNLKTGEIGPQFDECLALPQILPRVWDHKTKQWWLANSERKNILNGILARMRDPYDVIVDFIKWNGDNGAPKHFWSKPSHFDYNLLDSYFRDYHFNNPFIYWKARDMRSYLLGLYFPEPLPDLRLKSDDAHNALADTMFQVSELIRLTREKKNG